MSNANEKSWMTIGELAEGQGVNIQTIRYYEKRKLITPQKRTDSGYRLYSKDTAKIIAFIKTAQSLGFTLKEVNDLLKLRVSSSMTCGSVKQKALKKVEEIDKKISDRKMMKKTLQQLAQRCETRGVTSPCPIIDNMEIN